MALHLVGVHQPEVHKAARNILHQVNTRYAKLNILLDKYFFVENDDRFTLLLCFQMSYFQEFYHDFANCYVKPDGRDIEEGKLTWLIVVACQRANARQKAILHESYGAGIEGPGAEAKAIAVRKVYKELNLKKALQVSLDNTKSDVHQRIQSISKIDKIGLDPQFFFRLMDEMSTHDIS